MTTLTTPRPAERLAALGIELPAMDGSNVVIHERVARTGAIAPTVAGAVLVTGRVGHRGGYAEQAVPISVATDLARAATLNAIASTADAAGGIDAIERILTITAQVAITADAFDYGSVLDSALSLVDDLFGAGNHPAVAIHGVVSLPANAPVAIELIALVRA